MTERTQKKYFYFVLFLIGALPGFGFSQSFTGKAKLDTNVVLIGDQVKIDLQFSIPAKTLFRFPLVGDTLMHGIQVVSRSKVDTTVAADKKSLSLHQTIVITSFDSGAYMIPEFKMLYRQPPDTTIRFIPTETLMLNVHTVSVDTTKAFKPIKGPIKVPLTFREILPYLLFCILILAIIGIVIWYLRKRKKAEPIFQLKPKVIVPPHEIAIAELNKLKGRKLWQEGKVKEYHSVLTDIIRSYIEGRFGVMAMEMTTDEILNQPEIRMNLSNTEKVKLDHMLSMADLVKFAKMQPLPTENEMSLEYAFAFVQETIQVKEQNMTHD
ncbi:MAG: hypothetical protein WCL00_06565 [Bacteroidota bacterium]